MDISEALATYREFGHVVVPALVDHTAVAELSILVEAVGRFTPANGVMAMNPAEEPARSIAEDRRLVELAAAMLESEAVCFGLTFVVKPPHHGLPVLWHQDGFPWRERWGIHDAVTLWVAIDAVDPERGGLMFIPGSHRLGLYPLRPNTESPNVFGWESPPELVDEAEVETVALAPGDASVHHPALVHASGPNRSPHRRAVLALRYCAG